MSLTRAQRLGGLLAVCLGLHGQSPLPQPEVPSVWDTRQFLKDFDAQNRRLTPILQSLKVEEWVSKGAPEAYLTQWKSTQAELGHLQRSIEEFGKNPEKLTAALETLFRMQSIQAFLDSLSAGTRAYQNPALADLLQGVIAENAANREKLKEYILELAAVKEQEFEVADREAQRCRGMLMSQPPPPARKTAPKGERKAVQK